MTLTLRGQSMRLSLNNATLGRVDVEIGAGSVSLPQLSTVGSQQSGVPSKIKTGTGNVFISTRHTINATYFQRQAQTCLAGASVSVLHEECVATNATTTNTTQLASPVACRGTALLCGASGCELGQEPQAIVAESDFGSIHFSVLEGLLPSTVALVDPAASESEAALTVGTMRQATCDDNAHVPWYESSGSWMLRLSAPVVVAKCYNSERARHPACRCGERRVCAFGARESNVNATVRTSAHDSHVGLHAASANTILGVQQWIEEAPGFDFIVYIHIDGQPARDTWVYSSKAAIAQLDPGWLSTFSAGLLRPRIRHVRLQLSPTVCPLGIIELTPFGGAVSSMLRDVLDVKPGQALHHVMSDELECKYQLEGASSTGAATYIRRFVSSQR